MRNSNKSDTLYQVQLLQALRNGDPALIHPFLDEIAKDKRRSASPSTSAIDTGAAALHLAIRCATASTVALLLSHRAISPNGVHPPGSRTTPLHLAASLGRVDIVQMLLEQDGIDDSLRDAQGRSIKDVAKGKGVMKVIHDSHTFLNASFRSLLRSYILSPLAVPPPSSLIDLLSSPRTRFLNLSYIDDTSGTSLLHEAARRRDLRLIELAVRAGADVFVRDRRGRMPGEGLGSAKDERVRVFLKQFANHDTTLLIDAETSSRDAEPPTIKGYLNKYTNVAKGYNTRWFVLKNGILSYYRHQSDETVASRGSISLKSAILKLPPPSSTTSHLSTSITMSSSAANTTNDRMRIEVHAHGQKWYIKTNHPVEAARWAAALRKSAEWARREEGEASSASASASVSGPASLRGMESERRLSGESRDSFGWSVRTKAGTLLRKAKGGDGSISASGSASASANTSLTADAKLDLGLGGKSDELQPGEDGDNGYEEDDEDGEGCSMGSGGDGRERNVPYEKTYELQGNAALAQMELTLQLAASLGVGADAMSSSVSSAASLQSPAAPLPITALYAALQTANTLLSEHIHMSQERDAWFRAQAQRARRRQAVWAESLATVVREGEGLERELRTRSRRRGSSFFDASEGGFHRTIRTKPSTSGFPRGEIVKEEGGEVGGQVLSGMEGSSATSDTLAASKTTTPPATSTYTFASSPLISEAFTPPAASNQVIIPIHPPTITVPVITVHNDEGDLTDDEDEFFDAIESGTLPGLIVPPAFSSPVSTPSVATPSTMSSMRLFRDSPLDIPAAPYAGYLKLRLNLELNEERPSTSLWSVLKHSIGKDLTKISFPVFFNEPTSMLQRMAEDMEFTECLDAAVKERDPLRRIAFVAAFAMSNYSSTIGRIAKPFNPMLSETFEYVRFDKEFRYYSEQVSHHPPISACWAEAPSWHYYGEVDAQNKFMGKSFEIRPTGIAHAELILPADRVDEEYPKAPARFGPDKVVEHYSWKKVTTNVSGFILGSPTIDHYGDMIVTNHRTGDQCILTFKPRGWRGKDAFEIAGQVVCASGKLAYRIAGRWNSQLIASPASPTNLSLNPDLDLNLDSDLLSSIRSTTPGPAHFLLWRNSKKRVGSPFNLTPFAITLNDCPKDTLAQYICPTDCRLRPDQRAFEMGKWELANDLKRMQEEKQRAIRKAREEGKMAPHRPRWFTAETDGDTGERVWAPSRVEDGTLEYWAERERVYKGGGNAKAKWKDVDDIFIEAPDDIKF